MKQEEKDLLLRDLCYRLPYRVKMNHIADNEHSPKTLIGIAKDMITLEGLGGYECVDVEHYKPYLFPLSSMTEEQKVEFDKMSELDVEYTIKQIKNNSPIWTSGLNRFNWFLKNHFDVYELIPIGLAVDCTNLNIY